MASRAVRKALKEQEAQDLVKQADDDEEEVAAPKKSAFALLNELDGNEESNDAESSPDDAQPGPELQTVTPPRPKGRKKKKTKPIKASDPGMDEIDAALKTLKTSHPESAPASQDTSYAHLKIDTSHLHAENEMRRLFGRTALQTSDEEDQPRRRNRQQGLAAAVGRQGRSGLASLTRRRNIFIQGQEDWPRGTSEGLSMEVVEKRPDGTVEYAFVHNKAYREVQTQFLTCVESMDPERMVALLQYHPYHISTLLQVSEIAKQERDYATSGMLLERALFSFGRCVHTTFAASLAAGNARLDFKRLENRELWTAATRYVANLSMRSTWRTVLEWAKMLLALDPRGDPYCMRLVIDQYALRARQPRVLLDLIDVLEWSGPNIAYSKSLALTQIQDAKGKQALYTAVARYPYIASELCKELKVDPPSGVWGKMPRSDWEKLHADLYTTRAKDVWNTPEATNLLLEIASALSSELPEPTIFDKPIDRNLCRHVLLTDQPALIALLPKDITSQVRSVSDPLPPVDVNDDQAHGAMWLTQFIDMYGTMLETISDAGMELRADFSLDEIRQWIRDEDAKHAEERMTDEAVDMHAGGLELLQQAIGRRAVDLFVTRHRSGSGPEYDRANEEIVELFSRLML